MKTITTRGKKIALSLSILQNHFIIFLSF